MGLVAAVGTAVTAIASSVGIAVTATALTVGFETVAAVGAVLGVVGQVTHNKALSFAGLGLGAVGGIGALASSAGLLGSGAVDLGAGAGPTATAAASDAASAGTIDSVAGSSGFAAADQAMGLPPGLAGADAGVGEAAPGAAAAAADQAMGLPPGLAPSAGTAAADQSSLFLGGTTAQPVGQTAATPPSGAAATPDLTTTSTAPTVPVTQQPLPGPTPGAGGNAAAPAAASTGGAAGGGAFTLGPGPGAVAGTAPGAGTNPFSGLLDYANNHQLIAYGAIQAGGALLSGLTSTLTPANVNQLNSQAALNDAAAAQQKMQTANLQMPKAVASSAPVTGTPQTLVPPATPPPPPVVQPSGPAGFINQGPVPSQPVTGVAA